MTSTQDAHTSACTCMHACMLMTADVLSNEPPFDAIHVGAAADTLPTELLDALARNGRMIIPVGGRWQLQTLEVVDRDAGGRLHHRKLMDVMYVPLTRPAEMEDGL